VLRAKEKERRSSIVCQYKRRKTVDLYTEKRPYSAKPSITTGDRSRVPVPELGLLLSMGAGEAHGRYKPPNATEATGLNFMPTGWGGVILMCGYVNIRSYSGFIGLASHLNWRTLAGRAGTACNPIARKTINPKPQYRLKSNCNPTLRFLYKPVLAPLTSFFCNPTCLFIVSLAVGERMRKKLFILGVGNLNFSVSYLMSVSRPGWGYTVAKNRVF